MFRKFLFSFAATIVFISAAAVIALGVFVSLSDAIFPNVSARGINLSGMTVSTAGSRLVSAGFENNAAAVAVTIYFPDGSGFTISGEDAGFSLCAQIAAEQAFYHGRGGSFFGRTFAFARSLHTPTDVSAAPPPMDEDFVRAETALHTRAFNDALAAGPGYVLNEYSITASAGIAFAPASANSVYEFTADMLHAALEENRHIVANYLPAPAAPVTLDLSALHQQVTTEPVSASWEIETSSVVPHVDGVSFNMQAAQRLLDRAVPGEEIEIPLIFTEPEFTTEEFYERIFGDVLAERTTNVGGTAARFSNVQLSAEFIDGMVLNPGDVFSFNQTVPRRTAEAGFLPAGGFRDGELVDMIGGGICQVASSIYDNVLHAHLEVVARRAHTLPISYLPHGHDASIYYGVLDFRFRNSTNYPLRIEIEFDGRSMTTRLVGTSESDYVIRIESISSAVPFDTIYREDPNVPPGETRVHFDGRNGIIAYTYRIISDADGQRISRTRIARDVYRTQNRVILVPPGGIVAEPEIAESPEAPVPAMSSG